MDKKKSKIQSIYDKAALFCADVGMLLIVIVCVLTVRHAAGRYFFSAPLTGNIDITCLAIIAAIFLCIIYAVNQDAHVSVGLFVDLAPKKAQTVLYMIVSVFVLVFFATASVETFANIPAVGIGETTVLKIPKYPFYYIIAVGFLLSCIGAAIDIFRKFTEDTGIRAALIVFAAALVVFGGIVLVRPFDGWYRNGDAFSTGIVGIIIFAALMFMKLPVAIAMSVGGFFTLGVLMGWDVSFNVIASAPFASLYSYTWSTVPMFVLMGYLAKNTQLAEDFYLGLRRWIGHLPGGMFHGVIIGNAAFGACSGDSIGAAVTFSSITLPETRKYQYDDALTLGCIAGGSVLSCVIPPSMPFIIYGATTQNSVGQMFIAGIVPGILLVLLYMTLITVISRIRPEAAPRSEKCPRRECLQATPAMLYLVVVFLVIIGGIYAGIFSPTEAGAFGVTAIVVIGILRRKLTLKGFLLSCRESAATLGMIGLLLAGSGIFQRMIVVTGVTTKLSGFLTNSITSPAAFLILTGLIMLVLGCFIDALPLLIITAPILYPISQTLGIHPIQFGVFMTLVVMCGTLTPPVGITVYALAGQVKDVSMSRIFRGVMPFIAVLVAFTLLIAFVPWLTTALVELMFA